MTGGQIGHKEKNRSLYSFESISFSKFKGDGSLIQRIIEALVSNNSEDIQLKFDGPLVNKLQGAPADAVISSLSALQRMIHIIGMRSEGRTLGQRLKPSARVKRDFAVVCRAPERGSHVQPFSVANEAGKITPSTLRARTRLLAALKAFDSGDDIAIREALPNARERWFMADAAAGLLPEEHSNLEVTVRAGSYGPFSFKAGRARETILRYKSGPPPQSEEEEIVGKLQAIDYGRTIITLKPSNNRAVRLDYPFPLERWLQANVRRRIQISGRPTINPAGDITSFSDIAFLSEIEPTLEPIESFRVDDRIVEAIKPIHVHVRFDYNDRLFVFQDPTLGIDAYSESYDSIRDEILIELEVLWRNFVDEKDENLANDALRIKSALKERFRVTRK